MHKGLNILPALLLCANIAVGAQDSGRRAIPLRFKPTDASGVLASSHVNTVFASKNSKMENLNNDNDIDDVSFSIKKVAFDPKTITFPLAAIATILGGGYYTFQQEPSFYQVGAGVVTTFLGYKLFQATCGVFSYNDRMTHGQHWFKRPDSQGEVKITLKQENGTWKAHYKKPETKECPSDQDAQQLAEEIIASHSLDVKDEDLYTSEIFQKLISDFKSRC